MPLDLASYIDEIITITLCLAVYFYGMQMLKKRPDNETVVKAAKWIKIGVPVAIAISIFMIFAKMNHWQ